MLLLAILFAGTIFVSAQQNADLQKWIQKDDVYHQVERKSKSPKVSNVINEAGIYLEKSAKLQYTAIGLAGGGALITGLGAIAFKDKTTNDVEYETKATYPDTNEPIIKKKTHPGRIACYVAGGLCGIAAICCQVASINYKLKAGRSLQMYTTGTGGGLAYTF